MKAKHGRVSYGGRAFHQDAMEAMGGDIVRGLIETITNSDDKYGGRFGKIKIEVEHRRGPWTVITRDRATGMSASQMEDRIAHLGGRTSGFEEGEDVRGNLGRGAKDLAAFGSVEFESIREGEFASLVLNQDGEYDLYGPRTATQQDRDRLGIRRRENGTVVTIHASDSIRCPQHAKLKAKLERHYQLRDIVADPDRQIVLVDANTGNSDDLHYSFPDLPVAVSSELPIEGYPEAAAQLTIFRNAERYDDPPSDPLRPAGILIKGRRAIYENTLFRFETNPYAGWFSGRVVCPHIDQLAQDYDDRLLHRQPQDTQNPIPIITRRRDGLQKGHPFYKALAVAVEAHLGKLVTEEERKAREHVSTESSRLRRTLDGLGRDLSKLIDEDLREIDEEGLLGSDTRGSVPPVRLIPPEHIVAYMGEDKTVSVMVAPELSAHGVTLQCEPEGVVELVDGVSVPLSPHKSRPDLLAGQIRLHPLLEDETLLTVTCGNHSDVALVEVRPERETVEVVLSPAERFQFERENYRIAWTRKKALRLFAPLAEIAEYGVDASVSSSDPGIVVRRGHVHFRLDEELEQYIADVTVEARALSSKATLTAKLGHLSTTCRAVVTKDEEGPALTIRIVDEEQGYWRATLERTGTQTTIKVMGRHPIMRRYRGPAPDFQGDDLPATKLIIAEIVADQVAKMILERKYPSSVSEQIDGALLNREHYRYVSKYLPRCHKALLPDDQLEQPTAGRNAPAELALPL